MKTTSAQSDSQDRHKKPYNRPKLIAYGDIRELTRSEAGSGAADGKYPPSIFKTSGSPV